ncbi:MAG: hypothetical protein EBU46_19200, partial [Nitrosomonadaceae bacterium]|nr:hypothetical protein [Nitrosomonadaceae bacterium]
AAPPGQFDAWRVCVLGDFLAEWVCLLGYEAQREMRDRLKAGAGSALAAGRAARLTAPWFRENVGGLGLDGPRAEIAALCMAVPADHPRRAPLAHWLAREPWQHFARATLQAVHEAKLRWLSDLDGAQSACALAKKTLAHADAADADVRELYRAQCAHARALLGDTLSELATFAEWLVDPPAATVADPNGRWRMAWTSMCLQSFIEEGFLDEYFWGIPREGTPPGEGNPLLLIHSCDNPVRQRLRDLEQMWGVAGI